MSRILLLTLIFFIFIKPVLSSQVKSSEFAIEYGFFKELGEAKATLESDGKSYSIRIDARTQGLAKFLSRDRKESYNSQGFVEGGLFVPVRFIQQKEYSNRQDVTVYYFDHLKKMITKEKNKYESGHLLSKSKEFLEYYAKNDILTLYFNVAENLKNINFGEHMIYHAVGANQKDGRVDIISPDSGKLKEVVESCGSYIDSRYLVVVINQKIFQSSNGELFIMFDKHGETKKAVLKNVILFGDIRGVAK